MKNEVTKGNYYVYYPVSFLTDLGGVFQKIIIHYLRAYFPEALNPEVDFLVFPKYKQNVLWFFIHSYFFRAHIRGS